jgi:transcriptional regulator with XRE-family HTH domain
MGNTNPIKFGRCIVKLEEFYGVRKGSFGGNGSNQYKKELETTKSDEAKTQNDIAKELGISQDTLNNYKKLTTLIPELQDLIATGEVKSSIGSRVWAKMSQSEQEKFFNEIGKDKLSAMTQKETQQYIDKAKQLEQENVKLKTELQNLIFYIKKEPY